MNTSYKKGGSLSLIEAIILGVIEGITEFLPISSTGHLTIAEKLMGYDINAPDITAFTAIIQIGAIAASLVYFRKDIYRIASAWLVGLADKKKRGFDYKFGWYIIFGSLPIAFVGLIFRHHIETTLRSLWFVVAGLIVWSLVLWVADRKATQKRGEKDLRLRDTIAIGLTQCIALIPGVSRSGATISAGLFAGIDRVTATRLSFFLGIPALVSAGILQLVTRADDIGNGVGWNATIAGIISSFIVGYMTIAWLLRFVAGHSFSLFIWYRLALGVVIATLLITGTIEAI